MTFFDTIESLGADGLGHNYEAPSGFLIDWKNRIAYVNTLSATGIAKFNLNTGTEILFNNLATIGMATIATPAAGPDSNGNIYYQLDSNNADQIYKINSSLISTANFGTVSGFYSNPVTQWPNPAAHCNTFIATGDSNYLISAAVGGSGTYILNADTMTFAGYNKVLAAQFNGFGCVGLQDGNQADIYLMDFPGSGTYTQINFYKIHIANGANTYNTSSWPTPNPYITDSTIGFITPSQVDPAWSHFIESFALLFDHTDNNLIFTVSTNDVVSHQSYVVKINSLTADVMWSIPLTGGFNFGVESQNTFVSRGLLALKQTGIIYAIDTILGVVNVTDTTPGLGLTGNLGSNDTTGEIVVFGNYTESMTSPQPILGTPSSYTNLWGLLILANGASIGTHTQYKRCKK